MPISEDEYDPRPTSYEASSTMSKAELRKTHKPIMEKKRRARINHCLNEIKTLILDAMKKDPARHSKLEKADILEMAVKHLQNVQRQQLALAMATDPSVLRKFKAGFNECAEEVNRYISGLEGLDVGLQQRISSHLSKCISGIEQIVHLNFPGFGGVPFLTNSSSFFSTPALNDSSPETPGDQNNNPSIQIPQGLQLIPSRLPTGEFALLLPNSNNLPYFSSGASPNQPNQLSQPAQGTSQEPHGKPTRPSAFVTVIPSSLSSLLPKHKSPLKAPTKLLSPPQSPTSSSCSARQEEEAISQDLRNSPSPRGFRPVNPSQRLHVTSSYQQQASSSMEPQALVTSTSTSEKGVQSPKPTATQTEVKTMRFPIQKFSSPQKLAEPLCIITNQSERFKHAQVLEETAHCNENLQRGVKRKGEFSHSGLLAVAPPSSKVFKTYHESSVADFRASKGLDAARIGLADVHKSFYGSASSPGEPTLRIDANQRALEDHKQSEVSFQKESPQCPCTSRGKDGSSESSNDMWRPW